MIPVKVLKIGKEFKVNTKFGEKLKKEYEIKTNTGEIMKATAWVKTSDLEVKEGDEVMMDLERQGSYVNIKGIEQIEQLPPPPPVTETKEVDWDGKERRMVRMNSYAHAVKIVEMSLGEVKKDLSEGDVFNLVSMIAHRIEEDIYRVQLGEMPDLSEEAPF